MSSIFPTVEANWNFGPEFPSRVLACMIREENFLGENWDVIKPEYFGHDDLQILAGIVIDHARTHNAIPDRGSLEALIYAKCQVIDRDGALGKIHRLIEWTHRLYAKDVGSVGAVRDHLRNFARRREVLIAMIKAVAVFEEDTPEKGDLTIDRIQGLMNEAFQVGTVRDSGTDWHEMAPRLPDILLNHQLHGKENKVPTGILEVDEILNGGLGAGELGVVMAPPNRGKSTVLANFAYHAACTFASRAFVTKRHKAVIFVTLEMHEEDIALKLASITSQIPDREIIAQRERFDAIIQERSAAISPVKIKFWSPGTANVDDIKWYISNLKMIHGVDPGLLILDYADLLRGGEDNRFWGMGEIYKQLIALGNQFGFGVWTGSQVRRADADDKTIRSTGAAESWKKVELADVIISLNQTDDEYESGLMRLHMSKVRRGQAKSTFYQKLNPAVATLSALTEEDRAKITHTDNQRTPDQDRNRLAGAEIDAAAIQEKLKALQSSGVPSPPPPPADGQ